MSKALVSLFYVFVLFIFDLFLCYVVGLLVSSNSSSRSTLVLLVCLGSVLAGILILASFWIQVFQQYSRDRNGGGIRERLLRNTVVSPSPVAPVNSALRSPILEWDQISEL